LTHLPFRPSTSGRQGRVQAGPAPHQRTSTLHSSKAGLVRDDPKYAERRALEFEKQAKTLPVLFEQVFAGWTDKDCEAFLDACGYEKT